MFWKYLPFILFTVITHASAQIMLKLGMNDVGQFSIADEPLLPLLVEIGFNPFVVLGVATFVVSMTSHIYVLSKVHVSFAYPFLSLAYVLVAVWAAAFLGETLSPLQIVGIGTIVAGTVLIASRPREPDTDAPPKTADPSRAAI